MNLPQGTQGIMGVLLEMFEAGTYAREEKREMLKKTEAARGRDQSRKASEDTLLCGTLLSNLTHTLLNVVLSRLNPTGPLYIAMNPLIQTNSMPERV